MSLRRWVAGVFVGAALCSAAQTGESPKLFGAGTISSAADDLSPAFTPDGKTVFFTRGNASSSMIMTSSLVNGQWSAPQIASFSGEWRDLEATMAPDGSFLVFASNRPASAGGQPLEGHYDNKSVPGGGGNLWRVDRTGQGWGTPQRLPDTINADTGTFSPSISADGSLYFMRPDDHVGSFHLYRSQYRNRTYAAPERLAIGDDTTEDVDPAVAADESYLVYSSSHPGKGEPKRLRIVLRGKSGWGAPIDLGDIVNEQGSNIEARLSPDGKTLYFSTNTVPPVSYPRSREHALRDLEQMEVWANGRQNIWYVPLGPWLGKGP
jgi:Tol biopolymer transport system component